MLFHDKHTRIWNGPGPSSPNGVCTGVLSPARASVSVAAGASRRTCDGSAKKRTSIGSSSRSSNPGASTASGMSAPIAPANDRSTICT